MLNDYARRTLLDALEHLSKAKAEVDAIKALTPGHQGLEETARHINGAVTWIKDTMAQPAQAE